MQAIKGGWVGQTFALAKCNDSGGKKSRIRRSKEERKAMVESFIKKYQKLNNGNFPSLNLTHKEVGGSFYTVRELVREVIQENRVLGPAKLTPEEESIDMFLEKYPLGSISFEPETDLSSSNESHIVTHILPSHHQDISEELVLNSTEQCPEPEHMRIDDGQFINGSSQAVEKNEEYDKAESRASESLEMEENVTELAASKPKVTHVAADVMVETFPLTSGSIITYGLDEKCSEPSESNGTLVEKEIEKVEMEAGNNNSVVGRINFQECSSDLGNEKAESNLADRLFEKSCDLVDKKPMGNVEALLLENSNDSTTKKGSVLDDDDETGSEVKDASPAVMKAIDAQDRILAQSLDNSITSSSFEQSISTKTIASENDPNSQHDGSSPKGSNPTLHRMNLESWETTSEKSAKLETNPLLAFFKSFIAAFAKFWSE